MKGFENTGNTCYFNTAVQCLVNIPVLSNHFLRCPYDGPCEFTKVYSSLIHTYWLKNGIVDMTPLLASFRKTFPRFGENEQHDVQEAIMCIIDILERAEPILKEWLYGKKTQETVWPGGKSSNEEECCIHLMRADGSDMSKMLEESTKWNVLENFQDTNGKVHNVAITRMVFSKLPKVLMLSFDRKSRVKVFETIHINDNTYELIASAVHVGIQNDGHYVSFVKRKVKWLFINDESIKEHPLPIEAGHYFMVYNLKTPSSEYPP